MGMENITIRMEIYMMVIGRGIKNQAKGGFM